MTLINFKPPAAVLLALIPLLCTLLLFLFVFVRFTHNKLTRPFFLFLIPFALWQLNEVFTRLSTSAEEVKYWCHLFNPFINFIPPLGIHFALVFTRMRTWQRPLFLALVLYLPAFLFFFLSYGGLINFIVYPSPFWNWLATYEPTLLSLLNVTWLFTAMVFMLFLFLRFALFKNYLHQIIKKQAKIILLGLMLPIGIAFVTEFLFPFVLGQKPVPLLVSTFTFFPLCVFIALYKYELFLFSPKYTWENIVNKMNEGIVIIDVRGIIQYSNEHFLYLIGYRYYELINTSIFNIIPDYENKTIFMQQIELRKKQLSGKYILVCRTKNNILLHFQVSGTPYYDKKGKVIGSVGVVEDITPMIKLELSLQNKINDLNTYIYRTHHDLRGPLTSIMGLCALAQNTITDKETLNYFAMIKRGTLKLDSVLQDLQWIYNISQSVLSPAPLNLTQELEKIKQSITDLNNYSKIIFNEVIELQEYLITDKALLNTILHNLLVNAVNYADLEKNPSRIEIRARKINGHVEITVKDNGIGIEQKYQQRIWELFYRANDTVKGNGLGLYIAKSSVERLNGTIFLNSTAKIGSTFTILIPDRQN